MNSALLYASWGWRVFPCLPKNKTPLTAHGCKDATTDEAKIRAWWGAEPNANIGIATGKESDLTVIDLDGAEGIENGTKLGLVSNTRVLTGNGQQLFYKYQEGIKNSVKKIAPGIDIRNDGGYVIGAGSIHPNGRRYRWLYNSLGKLQEFPSALREIVGRGTAIAPGSHIIPRKSDTWLVDALSNLTPDCHARNDTFARIVGKLHHEGLTKESIWALLAPHARNCDFSEKELNQVIQSITRYPSSKQDDSVSGSVDVFLQDIEPVRWICEPIIASNSLGFIAGLPETYKTWLTVDLAIECAKGGGLWLGLFPVGGARVLFIDQERSKRETQRRFKGVMAAKGISAVDIKDKLFIRSGTTTRLDLDDSYRAFRRELMEVRPDIVIVDSFATFHVGDENDRMSIQKVIERIKELRTEFNCAFWFIDHENKSAYSSQQDGEAPNAGRMVGSIGKVAASESVLTVRRYDANTCAVYHTKSTMGQRVPSFNVSVINVGDGGISVRGTNA